MTRLELKWLTACAAIALGIGLTLVLPRAAELWPFFGGLTVVATLLGYGFAVRGWFFVALALLATTLAYRATVEVERGYRESPWMRGVVRRGVSSASTPRVRRVLSSRVGLGVAAPVTFNRAILLGERRGLSAKEKAVFIDSGAIHLFAISGLHVMVVAKVLMFIIALFGVSLRWQGAVAIPVLWAYVGLIGSPPSAIRAATMASLYFAAPIFWRRPNGIVAWAMSFTIIHLISPQQLAQVGSLFSFVVMFALIVAVRFVNLKGTPLGEYLFLTFVAWAAGVPIAAATFGRLTPGGILSNLVLISGVVYSVVSGLLGLLASFVWQPLAVHFNNLAAIMADGMVVVASTIARLPYANLEIPPWGVIECCEWYVAFGLLIYFLHLRQTRLF